jgi:hypothetical protein
MGYMDELSSMMMLVMIKHDGHNVGDVICATFHPKNPNVQTQQTKFTTCLSLITISNNLQVNFKTKWMFPHTIFI